jgi:hypothetical protein
MKRISCLLIILLLCFLNVFSLADDPVATDFQWQVGEELYYKVKYAFLTVGTLYFQVLEKDSVHNRPVYRCRLEMKSTSAIPFVHIDDVYESYIDEEVYAHLFHSYEKKGDHVLFTRYEFNYDAGQINIRIEKRSESDTALVLDSTVTVTQKTQDGLSLLFYARAEVKNTPAQDVSVFAFNELKDTFINFTGRAEEAEARGVKVDGYYLDGKMKFVGIAGIKEDFKGWFSRDPQSVPLHAKMKAFIGSVRINLEWWKNWEGETILGEKAIKENEEKIVSE